jgi:long-chain acyl-CoA synthetase
METLVQLLEQSARRDPERTALTMRAGVRTMKFSYGGLEQRAHAFARLLLERNLQKGDRVVIWAPNQPDWVSAMFGTFLAGGVLVPLDVRSTREFVERVVAQTEPVVAFAGRQQAPILRELEIATLELETIQPPVNGKVDGPPIAGDDLAEIIFTSGTTGDPKGVMLTQRNIASNVKAALDIIRISRDTRMLSLLPLSHMFEQVGGCFAPLMVGGAVAYPTSRQPAALARVLHEWKPTIIIAVPQALDLLMAGIEREAKAQGKLGRLERLRKVAAPLPERARRMLFRPVLSRFGGHLDLIASGGAALDTELQLKWEAMGIPVIEGYGATECAPVVALTPREDRRLKSVGKTLPGQQLRISEDGEVLARGPNVFGGYWNNEAASRAVFDGDWYHTGDLGYIEDGYLYLKGRKKDLIVLSNGQNVYPEDLEETLRHRPGVKDAVVFGLSSDGDVRVHAVVAEEEPGSAAVAVRGANEQLDDRQQIRGFSAWPGEDFPRTHTLKVKRSIVLEWLEQQDAAAPEAATPAAVDSDPLTRLVAQCAHHEGVVAETAQLGNDLNLDSLGRVELLSAIEEEIGVYVDDTAVGPRTTVAELRAMVEKGERKPKSHQFPTWPRWRWVRWLRRGIMSGVAFPLLRLGYSVEVRGREHFARSRSRA